MISSWIHNFQFSLLSCIDEHILVKKSLLATYVPRDFLTRAVSKCICCFIQVTKMCINAYFIHLTLLLQSQAKNLIFAPFVGSALYKRYTLKSTKCSTKESRDSKIYIIVPSGSNCIYVIRRSEKYCNYV